MALGSLFVELGLNSAAFVEGLNRATYEAKAATQKIGTSLKGLGTVLSELGGELGQFGGIAGSVFSTMGGAISKLSKEFGSFGSGAGAAAKAVGIGLLGLGAAATTAGAAVVGIAMHTAETAARLHELSEATGVSAHELSGLSIVGKLAGVDIEVLAKGIERLDRSALVAASGSSRASGAWKTLGISVTDATGHLKSSSALFGEVADKFSNMEDGAAKTGLAIQLFGRAGANLIPVLNKGSEAIKYWIDYGTKVGAVLTDEAAAGAHNFEEQMTKLGLISTGLQNKLMAALLPAIDHIVIAFTDLASRGTLIQSFGSVVAAALTKIASAAIQTTAAIAVLGAKWDQFHAGMEKFARSHSVTAKVLGYTPKPVSEGGMTNEQLDAFSNEAKKREEKIKYDAAMALEDLYSNKISPAGPGEKGKRKEAPIPAAMGEFAKPEKDYAGDLIAKATQATAAELAMADSIGMGTAALLIHKAAAQADTQVVDTIIQITDRLKALSQEEAAAVASGNAKKTQAIRQQIDALHQQELAVISAKDRLTQLFETKEVAQFAVETAKAFETANEKLQQTIIGMNAIAAATNKGGQALVAANIEAKLDADKQKLDELTAAYRLLDPASQAAIDKMGAIQKANADLDRHRQLLQQEYNATLAVEAAHANLQGRLADENARFDQLARSAQGADAKMVLLAQHQANVNRITTEWDNAALAVGTFGQKVKAVMDQLAIESQQSGKKIAEAFKTAIDGVAQNFADLVVKGKANWSQLFDSLESAIIKQIASAALNKLIKMLGKMGSGDDSEGGDSGGGGWFGSLVGGLFGGGKAAGGPVAPGVSYLVGEKGPEMFSPGVAGTIVPNPGSSAPQVNANVTMNIHGATDPDTFRKAGPQIGAQLYRQLQVASARNGGQA